MRVNIDQLVVTAENPRHTQASEHSHKALMASLGTHGLIQPIVVRPYINGKDDGVQRYEVIAGTRRLAAARELGWPDVEVVENDAEYGVSELGAAENMMREGLHPLDECKVITRLVADGESIEAVAGRFGQTQKWVEQRIRLMDLCPEVQDAFRDGLIGMAAAQAYTLADKAAQKHYGGKFLKPHQVDAQRIRDSFTNASFDAANALFPLKDYPPGAIVQDLFGGNVWLEDRKAFETMQKAAIERVRDMLLKEEGWGDVVILWQGPDYSVTNKYVKAEGRVLKADRPKYVVLVTYNPRSGHCAFDRGYVLRKDAAKTKPGATAAQDTVEPEAVAGKTADELSPNQLAILGALQTHAIERAIAEGDVHLALWTLLGPLLSGDYRDYPVWCGGRPSSIDYKSVNAMMAAPIEELDDEEAAYKMPTRQQLGEMTVNDIAPLLCHTALRSMQRMHTPHPQAATALKAAKVQWLKLDEGFLKRYRLDALQDLAGRLKIDISDLKKSDLIAKILTSVGDRDLSRILKLNSPSCAEDAAAEA